MKSCRGRQNGHDSRHTERLEHAIFVPILSHRVHTEFGAQCWAHTREEADTGVCAGDGKQASGESQLHVGGGREKIVRCLSWKRNVSDVICELPRSC